VITGLNYFGKPNIANDVAGVLRPIVGRSGLDTVDLFTFLTLSDFRVSFGISKSMRRGLTPRDSEVVRREFFSSSEALIAPKSCEASRFLLLAA
jgi:hypothetical protein